MSAALVFAGGGGKGAYEIGVWKAMHELGLEEEFTSAIGTSVGALNALLFGQEDYAVAEKIWRELHPGKILVPNASLGAKVLEQAGKAISSKVSYSAKVMEQAGKVISSKASFSGNLWKQSGNAISSNSSFREKVMGQTGKILSSNTVPGDKIEEQGEPKQEYLKNLDTGSALASQSGLKDLLERYVTGNLSKDVYVCCSCIENSQQKEWISGPGGSNGTFQMHNPSFDTHKKPFLVLGEKWKADFLGVNMNERAIPEYIKLNGLEKEKQVLYLLASSALPAVYDSVAIDGKKYRDGGIVKGHNFPYQKAVELGYQHILAVDLKEGASGACEIGGSQIYLLRPSESLGNFVDGTIDFDSKNAKWRMDLGYQDFMAKKSEILGCLGKNQISAQTPDYILALSDGK